MKTTANYGLKKPDGNDVVNINDLNYNTDILDVKLKEVESKASNIKVPVTSVNSKTGAIVLNSNDIKTNDGSTVEKQMNNFQSQIDSTNAYFNTVTTNLNNGIGQVDNKADEAKKRADEAFQFANDGKTKITNVVGSPLLATDTFQQQGDKIQTLKNTLASNLQSKKITAAGTESLNSLINKIPNIATSNIKSIQRGIRNKSSNSSKYQDSKIYIPINPINVNNSIIFISPQGGNSNSALLGNIESSTQISLSSYRNYNSSIPYYWTVIEFQNIKNIQKGTASFSSVDSGTININTVNPSKSLVFASYNAPATTNTECIGETLDANKIYFVSQGAGVTTMNWAVVEFN